MLWLGSIRRWLRNRGRRIFRFEVDGQARWADPMRLCALIEAECPKLDDLLDVVRGEVPDLPGTLGGSMKDQKTAAGKELVRVARVVFGLPELDGSGPRPTGVTDAEAVAVLSGFVNWLGESADMARPTSS